MQTRQNSDYPIITRSIGFDFDHCGFFGHRVYLVMLDSWTLQRTLEERSGMPGDVIMHGRIVPACYKGHAPEESPVVFTRPSALRKYCVLLTTPCMGASCLVTPRTSVTGKNKQTNKTFLHVVYVISWRPVPRK